MDRRIRRLGSGDVPARRSDRRDGQRAGGSARRARRIADPSAAGNLSGKWVSGPLANPYDRNTTSTLHFEFEQWGETLFGTVREKSNVGAAVRGIQGGQITGDAIVFYTQSQTTSGSGLQSYKEHYHGRLKGRAIEFIRQNDVPTGGLPQKFTATRE